MMVIALSFVICHLSVSEVLGQPANRRKKPANATTATQQTRQGQLTQRARMMFPTAIDMPEDVVWRRDIYREIDLTQDANGGLYYPVEPVGHDMNLFTYMFKLDTNTGWTAMRCLPTLHVSTSRHSCLTIISSMKRMTERFV